jgi:hypothetical protein
MIILRFFPNGEFTKGISFPKKKKSRSEELSRLLSSKLPPVKEDRILKEIEEGFMEGYWKAGDKFLSKCGSTWMFLEIDSYGRSVYTVTREDGQVWVLETYYTTHELIKTDDIRPIYLGLSNVPILDKSPVGRKKCLTMTRDMKRNIRNGVYLLEQKYGKDYLSFLTLTLPSVGKERLGAVCENWDYCVNRFLKWLVQKTLKKGYKCEYIYCTEIQSKRLEHRGEFAPHLHIVFNGKRKGRSDWSISPKMARRSWTRIIKSFIAGGFDNSALENLQGIRKSAGAYLSKYLSKGKVADDGSYIFEAEKLHTQWGGMSRSISRGIRAAIKRYTSSHEHREFVLWFIRSLPILLTRRIIRWYSQGFIPISRNTQDLQEWGIHVASGLLHIPSYEGGLLAIFEWFNIQKSTDEVLV